MDLSDITPPATLTAMHAAVLANTATCGNALDWSMKTYELVKPVADGMAAAQAAAHVSRRDSRIALLAATFAMLASCVAVACEIAR